MFSPVKVKSSPAPCDVTSWCGNMCTRLEPFLGAMVVGFVHPTHSEVQPAAAAKLFASCVHHPTLAGCSRSGKHCVECSDGEHNPVHQQNCLYPDDWRLAKDNVHGVVCIRQTDRQQQQTLLQKKQKKTGIWPTKVRKYEPNKSKRKHSRS